MSILIIDDEVEILKMLERNLGLEGITCHTATSAEAGIVLHREKLFPVVLTDIRMPGMDGLQFVREIKKTHPTCIPIIMTGYVSMDYVTGCFEVGAHDFFRKPLEDLNLLLDTLKMALARHKRWLEDLKHVTKTKKN